MEEHVWLVFSFGAIAAWGLWSFLPKLALAKASPQAVFVFEAAGAVAMGAVILPFADRDFHPVGALCAFGAGIFGYLGVLTFLRLAEKTCIGPAAAATALYPVVTVVLGAIFLGERPGIRQAIGIALALGSVYLINLPAKRAAGAETGGADCPDAGNGAKS